MPNSQNQLDYLKKDVLYFDNYVLIFETYYQDADVKELQFCITKIHSIMRRVGMEILSFLPICCASRIHLYKAVGGPFADYIVPQCRYDRCLKIPAEFYAVAE